MFKAIFYLEDSAIHKKLIKSHLLTHKPNIVIVDDEMINIHVIVSALADDFNIVTFQDGQSALTYCLKSPPDLILLDIEMPDYDGIRVCEALKSDELTENIPVIFVTGHTDYKSQAKGWDAGCVDFINKPIHLPQLVNRVEVHLALKLMADKLRTLAFKDGLTQIANRREFEDYVDRQFRLAQRIQSSLSLIMLDIDNFKQFNDHFGHLHGDDCLKSVAKVLMGSVSRPTDFVARYGGEEFAIVLPDTDEKALRHLSNAILHNVRDKRIEHPASNNGILTVSIGGATMKPSDEATQESLIEKADHMLYEAKRQGRNRACL